MGGLGTASLVGAGLLASFSGCASKSNPVVKANAGKLFAVTAEKTSFYRYGPQQGNGEDKSLPKDTLMTLIRPSFGYCKVHLVAGEEGYVASEDIRPAPATLLAALSAPVSAPGSTSESFDIQSNEPPPPEALPDPDLPPASDLPASTVPLP
jgi:hypothetical protein